MHLTIGITIGLKNEDETLWNNGIKQNAVFLAEALRNCSNVALVVLVNTTQVQITERLPWNLERWPTVSFDTTKDKLDVLIELGGQIDEDQTAYLKQRGTRLVSYCCGFEYIHAMESILFNRPLWGYNLFVNQRYDAIWMVPQVANNSQSFFEVLRRRNAETVPFVWSPIFLEQRSQALPNRGIYQQRHGSPRRLVVMEPNLNLVKFCLYPIFIAELAYRQAPDDIEILRVTNAEHIATQSPEFIALMNQLDIVRQHKAVFLGRYDTPSFLAEHTDIVISHQLENPLNYFYLEVCWQGFPLIHNAHLCPDLGYFYPENRADLGAELVLEAIRRHDADADAYRATQREKISRYLPGDETLVQTYSQLLQDLMARPLR
jgi:hypothetical protein